jgi:CBS domain-containing protein
MNNRLAFLKTVTPFNLLSEDILRGTAELLQEITYHQDTLIYQQEVTRMKGVDIIAEGEYESFFYDSAQNKRLVEIHPKGFCYGGVSVLLNRKQSLRTAIAKKGTVVYFLPRKHFRALCKSNDDFFHYFTADFGIRMQNEEFAHFFKRPASFEESFIASDQLYSQKLESMEQRAIVSCDEDTPIYEAAKVMAQNKVSCLFIRNGLQKIIGFVTDITLRDNVVAAQADVKQSIKNIMDPNIRSIHADAYVYEATLLMLSTKTRYLLIEKNGEYVAFISRNKLLSEQTQSPMAFIQSVKLAVSVVELKKKWQSVPRVVYQLLERGVHAEIVNQVITSVADIIALKVIEGIIKKMGEPPARFVFMVLGSEGRKEQTLKTDQDNAIIYEDKANEHREEARTYFLDFAKQVSDQLNNIGFSYCTGGFMAQNPKWTHSLSHWKRNYESWMIESVPETVIKFSTFFDCRYIYGDPAIIDELKSFLDKELQKPNETLFFHMATNALQYEPPLTFFNNIKTFTKGSQEVFDVKKAMTPIVDMVRVYALKNRIFEVNTGDRIKALKEKGVFTEKSYQELMQAYYLLMRMRLIKQANQIINDKAAPDNYVNLNNFTKIEQLTLKAIFKTIGNFQTGLKIAFTSNLFG